MILLRAGKGWEAHELSAFKITPTTGFGLSKNDLERLLGECLKPEEISGEITVQRARVKELINWFRRFADGNANPKWFRAHAFELAYYVAINNEL